MTTDDFPALLPALLAPVVGLRVGDPARVGRPAPADIGEAHPGDARPGRTPAALTGRLWISSSLDTWTEKR